MFRFLCIAFLDALFGESEVMYTLPHSSFRSVYGPVQSWRYGRSLGIDPIGPTSICSFDCVYCQMGRIAHQTRDRQVFVPTLQVLNDLHEVADWQAIDILMLSGGGEPTLALNLGEIIGITKALVEKPVGVLTNGSLLMEATVREELAIATQVVVKVDAVSAEQFQRINRPLADLRLTDVWWGLKQFRRQYNGFLAIQTLLLWPWSDRDQEEYIALMNDLAPDEIQLNVATRPRPLSYRLDRHKAEARPTAGPLTAECPLATAETLQAFGDRIHQATRIAVRSPFHGADPV